MSTAVSNRPSYIQNALKHLQVRIENLDATFIAKNGSCFFYGERNREKHRILNALKTKLENNEFLYIENNRDLEKIGFSQSQIKTLYKGFFSHKTEITMNLVFRELQQMGQDNFLYRKLSNDIRNTVLNENQTDSQILEILYSKIKMACEKIYMRYPQGTLAKRTAECLCSDTFKGITEKNPRALILREIMLNLFQKMNEKFGVEIDSPMGEFLRKLENSFGNEQLNLKKLSKKYSTNIVIQTTPKKRRILTSKYLCPIPSPPTREVSPRTPLSVVKSLSTGRILDFSPQSSLKLGSPTQLPIASS